MQARDKKSSILFLLPLMLSISLMACGGGSGDTKKTTTTPTTNNLSIVFEKTNTGTGSITLSSPDLKSDRECKVNCIESFKIGSKVTLTDKADSGSSFKGYGVDSACTDNVVTMDSKIVCKPIFVLNPSTVTFNLKVALVGQGIVTSSPAGIDCGTVCAKSFPEGSTVELTATPATGNTFDAWSGTGCTSSTITMSADVNCTATFKKTGNNVDLTVNLAGAGSGTVALSSPAGKICSATPCVTPSAIDSVVTLTAKPAVSNIFAGWSGACTSVNADPVTKVTMSTAQTCTATFDVDPNAVLFNLVINLAGSASTKGEVTSIPAGINCGTMCNKDFTEGSIIELTAKPLDPTSKFISWGGACTGTLLKTKVTMDAIKDCTATFDLVTATTFDLTVKNVGMGVITSKVNGKVDVNGIDCGKICTKTYDANTVVELTATEAQGNKFDGWTGTGECKAALTNPINVTMDAMKNCTATFSVLSVMTSVKLTLLTKGTGTGKITATPAGKACNGVPDCWMYNTGEIVKLMVEPALDSTFVNWVEPACEMASVTLETDMTCTAVFDLGQQPMTTVNLTLLTAGPGAGTITRDPMGMACDGVPDCWTYNMGETVLLTLVPEMAGTLASWEPGACEMDTVTLTDNVTCTAIFETAPPAD